MSDKPSPPIIYSPVLYTDFSLFDFFGHHFKLFLSRIDTQSVLAYSSMAAAIFLLSILYYEWYFGQERSLRGITGPRSLELSRDDTDTISSIRTQFSEIRTSTFSCVAGMLQSSTGAQTYIGPTCSAFSQ